ncbi:hypothetical protein CMP1-61 [Clavibacter phage CMP1]|uniref:Uncharacterized protein n=1 Tax=Clavibacter phage CMP1 TaxID=686439 RepID=D0U245_9CAUD|nr:hypothetical protein CMP1-61 [Clavibacter phage CMP1]ACY35954.1 hypothetical protein CMP1-61 [Clavibacter phage CMP1]
MTVDDLIGTRPGLALARAAFERVARDALDAADPPGTGGRKTREEVRADLALVRAALTPPSLPVDLAEIQARRDAVIPAWARAGHDRSEEAAEAYVDALEGSSADVPALVAELAELRARPTLTAEDARALLAPLSGDIDVLKAAQEKARTIANWG